MAVQACREQLAAAVPCHTLVPASPRSQSARSLVTLPSCCPLPSMAVASCAGVLYTLAARLITAASQVPMPPTAYRPAVLTSSSSSSLQGTQREDGE